MFWIGCHLSSAKGYLAMGKQAEEIGANVFQFFTRNPRGGSVKALDMADVEAFLAFAQERGFGPLLAHAPYTMNLCAAKPELREFARETIKEDLARLELLPGTMFNFHPGSHVKQGAETGIALIADALNDILSAGGKTPVLLETMAGKGSEVGSKFEELAEIIRNIHKKDRVKVCLDTCHIHDAGYDINEFDAVLDEFNTVIGLDKLAVVHVNDSKNPQGARKDRHENIGQGYIGFDTLAKIVHHPKLESITKILETPYIDNKPPYKEEIEQLLTWKE